MWKRNLTAAVLSSSGASDAAAWWQFHTGKSSLRVLAYHRVLPKAETVWDDGVVDATVESFRRQMEFVKRRFTVLSFAELAHCSERENGLPPNALIITFDDGYRDNYVHAYPILAELGLPATIFLATGYIGGMEPFWWDQVAYCIKQTKSKSVIGCTGEEFALASDADRPLATQRILRSLKAMSNDCREDYIAALPRKLDVEWRRREAEGLILSWDEIREMARNGIEFGGHTITHPVLTQVSRQQAEREITGCKARIEAETGQSVVAFAYPIGGAMRFDEEIERMTREAGYQFAVSYMRGVNSWPLTDRFAIQRFAIDHDDSYHVFRAKVSLPSIVRY
jgi:peptidoglycan/xylan/chitin deacetylase (PgdA/CDA1 family)